TAQRLKMKSSKQPWPNAEHTPPIVTQQARQRDSIESSTGIWLGIAAITMMFVALTSTMIVRQASSDDWRHFSLPIILYFNAVVLAAGSVVLHIGRRRFALCLSDADGGKRPAMRAFYVALVLGLTFVIGQYAALRQLRSEGIAYEYSPSSSFLYVF